MFPSNAYPLQFQGCNSAQFLAHQRPGGAPARGRDLGANTYVQVICWLDVTNGLGVSGDRYVVVDALSSSSSFYRLHKP
jgi:hypothetical protein